MNADEAAKDQNELLTGLYILMDIDLEDLTLYPGHHLPFPHLRNVLMNVSEKVGCNVVSRFLLRAIQRTCSSYKSCLREVLEDHELRIERGECFREVAGTFCLWTNQA